MLLDPSDIDKLFGISKIVFYKNGIVVQRKERFPMKRHPPTARKGVYEMSQKSKLNLAHIVANCEVKFVSMFTLTYGDFFIPYDGRELKRQINVFLGRFKKRYITEFIWFLEFTKKGRPHLHVICNVDPNAFDRAWLGMTWAKVSVVDYWKKIRTIEEMEKMIKARPLDEWTVEEETRKVASVHSHSKCWEKVRKEDGATRYCLKYALKSEQKLVPPSFHSVGRFWATSRGVRATPKGELIIGETMTEEQVRAIFLDTRVGQYPLIPKYVFERDAMEFFTSRGMLLTEIFDENGKHQKIEKDETVIE